MATVPVFRTWTAGEIATAAFFNSNVRDAGNFFVAVPVGEFRQTITQSFTTSVGAVLAFDTTEVDNDGGHSNVTNNSRYTAKTQGRFQVSGGISFASHADTNVRQVEVDLNGSTVAGSDVAVVGFSADNCRIATQIRQIFMNGSSDFVEIKGFQASTVTLATVVSGAAQQPHMSVRWVGTT